MPIDHPSTSAELNPAWPKIGMVRLRVKYEKTGAIRFTSHKDTMRTFRRGLAAGGVPVCYSQGFNPHPRLSFGPSLKTGWEGLGECMDIYLTEPIPDLKERCNRFLPEGLRVLETATVADSVAKLSADVAAARYAVTIDGRNLERANETLRELLDPAGAGGPDPPGGAALVRALESGIRERFMAEGRTDRAAEKDDGPSLLDFHINETTGEICIEYLTTMHQGRSVAPERLIAPFFGDPSELPVPLRVTRTELLVRRRGAYCSPISEGVVQKRL